MPHSLGVLLLWAVMTWAFLSAPATVAYSPNQTIPPAPVPSGLNATMRHQYGCESATEALALLDSPGWHNWIADDCGQPGHTPTAYSMEPSYLARYVADADDGEFWLVGSEPNIGSTYVAPQDAALFSQGWVTQTNVSWACCGTIQLFSHAYLLEWLDEYLAAGGAVGDAWHIHVYFVAYGSQWDATLAQFTAWMERNDVIRPVIVSETAQTQQQDASALLTHVAQAVCDEDVSAVYWYIGDKDAYNFAPQSELTREGEITPLGELFVKLQVCAEGEPTDDDTEQQPGVRVWLPVLLP